MNGATVRAARWFGLFLCAGLAGCVITQPAAGPPPPPNPFVVELFKQSAPEPKADAKSALPEVKVAAPGRLKPDLILKEIPPGTSVDDARSAGVCGGG